MEPATLSHYSSNSNRKSALDFALEAAARGYAVFPARGKIPAIRKWKDNATTDPARICRLWWMIPDANIAAATGGTFGLLVVDIDGRHGRESLAELENRFGTLPSSRSVK